MSSSDDILQSGASDDEGDDESTPTTNDDPVTGGSQGSGQGDDDNDDSHEETLVTKEGLKKLKDELDHLKDVRRKEVAQRLKEAISYGDLSENSEYEEAKNEQAFVEGRILELEEKIKNAKIIVDKKNTTGKEVTIGSTVTVKNPKEENEETYKIVGATEADPFVGMISNESPIGKSFLGHRKGDTVKVQTPSGMVEYEITKVA